LREVRKWKTDVFITPAEGGTFTAALRVRRGEGGGKKKGGNKEEGRRSRDKKVWMKRICS